MLVLVSTTSYEEALAILDIGVDIIDIKNVNEGSLGAQFPWVIERIVERAQKHDVRTSAALGDLPCKPGTAALAAYSVAHMRLGYIKAGLHGMSTFDQAFQVMDAVCKAVRMVGGGTNVVACGYGDYRRFDGVKPMDLVKAGKAARSDMVMLDTAIKDNTTLFENMPMEELREFVGSAHENGLQVALAGSLTLEDADRLFELNPDVIGVRGGVCMEFDRTSVICPRRTAELMKYFHGRSVAERVCPARRERVNREAGEY